MKSFGVASIACVLLSLVSLGARGSPAIAQGQRAAGVSGSIGATLHEGLWPCEGSTLCTACDACCFGQAAKVKDSCIEHGGTPSYCQDAWEDAVDKCKTEDCLGC